ncbi:MAG: DUF4105 domain-containing protein [Porphyromonadaceae bacterium]|nr:DUF4105 domain-containing protein [Porphyromonadaceae bacterium]
MKKLYSLLLYLCITLSVTAKAGDTLYVSLLTAAPGSQAYELFGHTGIRIRDIVFHYGLFDFSAPHFFYRFTKGETDYSIGAESYRDFIYSYVSRGSTVYEQELLLSKAEAERLCDTLLTNMRPENRIYRYNFLFDNCATRPRDKIEHCLSGPVDYEVSDTAIVTFRQLIHRQTVNNPWLTFGIDLALGAPLDHPIPYHQQMFLPYILQEAVGKAVIREEGDTIRPLVGESYEYTGIPGMAEENTPTPFTPTVVCTLLFLLILLFSIGEYRYGHHIRLPDYLIFGLYGLAGCLLFFLIFISIHPATSPNYSALWCHPFLWVIALCEAFAPKRRFTTQLMSLLLLVSIGVFVAMWFLPQVFNPAFYPLALIPAVRSVTWIKIELKNGRL